MVTTIIVVTATPAATSPPTATPSIHPSISLTPTPGNTVVPTAGPPTYTPPSTPTLKAGTPTQNPSQDPSNTPTGSPIRTPSRTPVTTPSATPLSGPIITAFEVADAGGQFNNSLESDAVGRPVYTRSAPSGFILFVEGRPGNSQLPVSTVLFNPKRGDPEAVPDLEIEANRALGNGSLAVCDNSLPALGGIPATLPNDFNRQQSITDALNDFACRFRTYSETDFACTQDSGSNFVFRNPSSTVQFCTLISDALTFPPGDTILTVRLRDIGGNSGPSKQIVVRVPGE